MCILIGGNCASLEIIFFSSKGFLEKDFPKNGKNSGDGALSKKKLQVCVLKCFELKDIPTTYEIFENNLFCIKL